MAYKIKDYLFELQKRGIYTFSLSEIHSKFPTFSKVAVRSALRRLLFANEIVTVYKGFYSIIPVSYALRGTVPQEFYIDHLMRYLRRPYYVGLLNAAAFYGAAHQQPQSFSVVTSLPPLRDIKKKGTYLTFISTRKEIPKYWLKLFRTESGDILVSKPELTAADLITYQKKIGGLSRALTIIYELTEILDFKQLDEHFFKFISVSTIQRLGYLLENVLEQSELANDLFYKSQEYKCCFQKIKLKNKKEKGISKIDNRWKIINNELLEIDDL